LAIAKHGNRAVSSKSGSADFYEALGIKIDTSAEDTVRAIKKTHFGFLFAPLYHAAMKHAAPVRRAIGIKTIMNLIGPLSNPAGAAYQMLGVYDLSLLAPVARASKLLGAKRVMVVCSLDGFDEISPCEKTAVFEIDEDGNEKNYFLDPKDFEIENCDAKELDGGTAEENALLAFDLMEGRGLKAIVEAVSLNAGAALYIGKKAGSIEEGYRMAKEAIISGRLKEKVKEIQEETNAKESA
jgi:anthranilate synthase/phosphoribosyltransferase